MINFLLLLALGIVGAGTVCLALFLGWVALSCALDSVEARRRRRERRTVEDATGRKL